MEDLHIKNWANKESLQTSFNWKNEVGTEWLINRDKDESPPSVFSLDILMI